MRCGAASRTSAKPGGQPHSSSAGQYTITGARSRAAKLEPDACIGGRSSDPNAPFANIQSETLTCHLGKQEVRFQKLPDPLMMEPIAAQLFCGFALVQCASGHSLQLFCRDCCCLSASRRSCYCFAVSGCRASSSTRRFRSSLYVRALSRSAALRFSFLLVATLVRLASSRACWRAVIDGKVI